MNLGRVKGTVVSTNKAEKLQGLKMLIVKPIDIETWQEKGGLIVAIDAVGAGEGVASAAMNSVIWREALCSRTSTFSGVCPALAGAAAGWASQRRTGRDRVTRMATSSTRKERSMDRRTPFLWMRS